MPRFSPRCVLLSAFVCLATVVPGRAACLTSGDVSKIITALQQTGTAELCQGAVFSATQPIKITQGGRRIFTTGLPTNDSLKATIGVPAGATYNEPVIQAYSAPNVEIRNIVIHGNRAQNPYTFSRALVAISGNNSVLDRVRATDTSGLSAVAAADRPSCSGLRITNNFIGHNGFHNALNQWANGIDVRCSNAYVAFNEIRDATDGGISFYGGTNTVIEYNWIANSGRSAWSGIIAANLYAGDFTGSVVRNNLIETCCGQHLHVALSVGTHLWCDDSNPAGDCQTSTGVSFLNNSGSGTYGFGIVVEGMLNATVQNNNLIMTQWAPQNCYVPDGNWYVINPAHSSGSFQPGYKTRKLHWPCLGPQS